jgi:hypothetical protein
MELRLRDAIACFLFLLIVTAAKRQAATVIYAATQNGPYKSADGGLTWKPITVNSGNSFLQGVPNLGAIAVDPQNPSTVCFAGAFNGGTSGFCKSTDAAQLRGKDFGARHPARESVPVQVTPASGRWQAEARPTFEQYSPKYDDASCIIGRKVVVF